jgi:nucleotide-binding universal stress UspA family protein
MFQKILVALDSSEMGKLVFDKALSLAKTTRACLLLLHVLSDAEVGYPNFTNLDEHLERWEDYKQQGLELLKFRWEIATQAGVNTECIQNPGASSQTICGVAKFWKADLIVIGHRGLSGIKELVQGSVSNYVLHHAPCSVLTIYNEL